ncbi:polysaccharide deacetylase family protein [Clostridium neuense]|uniref:Polysaccharide deacetylase family protein n=1 Tax=Clostridium neuense TaxID=1728934 RepID=A0ABW8TGF3_9CLOT
MITQNKKLLFRSSLVLLITIVFVSLIYVIKFHLTQKTVIKPIVIGKTINSSIGKIKYPFTKDGQKIAYLTFDGGPSSNVTPEVLNILKSYNTKATFFVNGKNSISNSDVLIRAKRSGNQIALRSFDTNYKNLYINPQNYLQDLKESNDVISTILGGNNFQQHLIRFPGGSNMVSSTFRQTIAKSGYNYVDWNVDSFDSLETSSSGYSNIVDRVKISCRNKDHIVILMHDDYNCKATLKALPQIIEYLLKGGYTFKIL